MIPFGVYRPRGYVGKVARLARALPPAKWSRALLRRGRRYIDMESLGPLDLEVDGVEMRLRPADNETDRNLAFEPRTYDTVERDAIVAALGDGDVFLDIGANVGSYALTVARRAPHARVIAVEPDPCMLVRLRANLALNRTLSVEIVPVVAARTTGPTVLHVNRTNRGRNSLLIETGERIPVEGVSLADLLVELAVARIGAMKMDIEGAEFTALEPFFRETPAALWPAVLVVERKHASVGGDAVALAGRHGYQLLAEAGKNVVLRRAP